MAALCIEVIVFLACIVYAIIEVCFRPINYLLYCFNESIVIGSGGTRGPSVGRGREPTTVCRCRCATAQGRRSSLRGASLPSKIRVEPESKDIQTGRSTTYIGPQILPGVAREHISRPMSLYEERRTRID